MILYLGEIHTERSSEGLMSLKWRDKRVVTMLSTFHDDTTVNKRRRTRLASGGVKRDNEATDGSGL